MKKKKAFSDGECETMTRERWNAAKFVRNQLCIALANKFDAPAALAGQREDIPHETFAQLTHPALGYIPTPDTMGILKRAAFIVFTKKYMYWRLPSELPRPVQQLPFDIGTC